MYAMNLANIGIAEIPASMGNPSYDYDCLDEAWEITSSFHVFIREWNTLAEFQKFLPKGTSQATGSGNPNLSGSESAACGDAVKCALPDDFLRAAICLPGVRPMCSKPCVV